MFTVSSFYRPRLQSLRRSISTLLLAVVTCSIVGVPFLAPGPEKVGRFPCEDGVCGCATAEACWDKCCCHSDVEKLAWAAAHHVSPPEFLVARVSAAQRQWSLARQMVELPVTKRCCCQSASTAAACPTGVVGRPDAHAEIANFAGSKCEIASADGLPKVTKHTVVKRAAGLRIVSLEDAAKCRGITWLWSLFSEVVVDKSVLPGVAAEPRLLFCLAVENDRVIDRAYCPDPPVP